jgi:predicted DNA-binding transcriptional regulator
MSDIIKLITELGSFGLLLAIAGWIIYNYVKDAPKLVREKEEFKKIIDDCITDIKNSIDTMNTRVTTLESVINDIKNTTSNPVIITQPSPTNDHTKQFLDRLKLGPQLHKTLNNFRSRINADHIFIGSFHNGNESITGIPYYKFDIIAEKFRPDKIERDVEFAFMYKDADLLRHDLLPSEVVQEGCVHYIIDEDGNSQLANVDDIIYRRMLGRDIKQLAVSLLRDPSGTPSGFVGCVRYDYEKIDIKELCDCGSELENIYAINEKLINSKKIS